jgi:hypothetical protein
MPTNDQIIECLISLGCDVPGALPRFIGNRDFYCRMLALVPDDENFETLGTALIAGDVETSFSAAHTLKGVLANMGLTPMYEEACAIVEPLRAGTTVGTQEHYNMLMQQREKLARLMQDEEAKQ